MKRNIEANERHGSLCFIRHLDKKTKETRLVSEWMCDCGKTIEAATGRVINGYKTSCGCVGKEMAKKSNTTHGMRYTQEYSSWNAIKNRCLCETSKDYFRYGGAGIDLFEPWQKDFMAFYGEIGPSPSKKHQVDRIDNRKGYVPGNIRWATHKQQSMNKTTSKIWTVKGFVFQSITDAANHFNVSAMTIMRWCYGFTDSRSNIFTPKREDCFSENKYQ